MRVLTLAYILALGGGLGLASAHYAVAGRPLIGKVALGAWDVWPGSGSRDIDPYMRAHLARGVYLPLGTGEGLELVATRDAGGMALTGRCSYRLDGQTPPSRGWTLEVTDAAGAGFPGQRGGFSDAEILRREDGAFESAAAASVQAGNWMPLPLDRTFQLRLRLYDTPLSSQVGETLAEILPRIERISCS